MRPESPKILGGLVLAVGVLAGRASALEVTGVHLARGAIAIKGAKAPPSATIRWEGEAVTEASPRGTFFFTTTVVPRNRPTECLGVGSLSAQVGAAPAAAIDVLVPLCDVKRIVITGGAQAPDAGKVSCVARTATAPPDAGYALASCQRGELLTGGGCRYEPPPGVITTGLVQDHPASREVSDLPAWECAVWGPGVVTAFAVCCG